MTSIPGGFDLLFEVARQQFPNDPLPHVQFFLGADPSQFGPEVKRAVDDAIRNKLIYGLGAFVNNILDEQTPSAIINFPRLLERNAGGVPPQGYALTPTPGRIIGGEIVLRFGR